MQRIEANGLVYEFEDDMSLMSLLDENSDRVYEGTVTGKTPPNDPLTLSALEAVQAERQRQDILFGDQSGNSMFEWISILGEEYGELCEAVNETCFKAPHHPDRGGVENIAKEATQVAAVALEIIEAAYRRKPEEGEHCNQTI